MENHRRIFAEHIVHQTITRFIEVWPDATIHELAAAMPHILHEAHTNAAQDVPARQLARKIVTTLWNSNLVPPWCDPHATTPQDALELA